VYCNYNYPANRQQTRNWDLNIPEDLENSLEAGQILKPWCKWQTPFRKLPGTGSISKLRPYSWDHYFL